MIRIALKYQRDTSTRLVRAMIVIRDNEVIVSGDISKTVACRDAEAAITVMCDIVRELDKR